MHDRIYGDRHNRLAQTRLNEAMYVHYNLRLRERQIRKRSSDSVSLDSVLQESSLYDWVAETEKQALQEDEATTLFTDMELGDAYEDDLLEFDEGSLEMASLTDMVEPLNVRTDVASDDDQDLNFLDDDDDEMTNY